MRIRHVEVDNFCGIQRLEWAPSEGMNCLIGAGDTTKTTILDAIELALNPRSYSFANDSDFYNLDVAQPIKITVSIGNLPTEFKADTKYGLYLRGWDFAAAAVHDEPATGLEDILSIRLVIDHSLEARWSLYNDRFDSTIDPPMIRYKDMQSLATTRLGPYADRHLSWSRRSVLSQYDDSGDNVSLRLAEASRAARHAFKPDETGIFKETVKRVQQLGRAFSVPVRDTYKADLDIQSVNINAGGIALHDGELPLRCLGTGSSRLLISALQHDIASNNHIALIDEVEFGLEPHRIARLLKYLREPKEGQSDPVQIFLTTHSPVVIRELKAADLQTVTSNSGTTRVRSISATAKDENKVQSYLRASPEAFLARRILVGEGKTECGLIRGLDACWSADGEDSLAFFGTVAISGGGKDNAPEVAETLIDLGYTAAVLLDSDEEPNPDALECARSKGATIIQWEGDCSTEQRMFLDVPWEAVKQLVDYAVEHFGTDAILAHINAACKETAHTELLDLSLPPALNTEEFRQALGLAAKRDNKKGWFKDIARAEDAAAILYRFLPAIITTPFGNGISAVRQWADGQS